MKQPFSSRVVQSSEYLKLFWLDWQMNPASFKYHAHGAYKFTESLDEKRLHSALKKIVTNNYNLRSVFFEENFILKQKIFSKVDTELECFFAKNKQESDILLEKWIQHPFNLNTGPLFRFVLIRNTSSDESIFLINFHHIIIDGEFYEKFIHQLKCLYKNINTHISKNSFENLETYISWEKNNIEKTQKDYWLNRIKPYLTPLTWPQNSQKSTRKPYGAKTLNFTVNKNIYKNLVAFNKNYNFSIFQILKTVWSMLITRYTNQEKIILCYPASIKPEKFKSLHGCFINTLFSPYTEAGSFIDQLEKSSQSDDLKQQRYFPIHNLLEEITTILGGNNLKELFKIGFASTSARCTPLLFNVKNTAIITSNLGPSELLLEYQIINDTLYYNINYIEELFSHNDIKKISHHFQSLLKELIKSPSISTSHLYNFNRKKSCDYATPQENTKKSLSRPHVYKLFEEQAIKNPKNIALYFNKQEITYQELNAKANQLARYLHEKYISNVKNSDTEKLIAVCMPPSINLVIAILAILKAGAAYIPIDAKLPLNRICAICSDAKPLSVITENLLKQQQAALESSKIPLVKIDKNNFHQFKTTNLDLPINSHHLAYVIYTSGTTGHPKGVLIKHSSVVNLIFSLQHLLQLNTTARVLQYSSIDFDVFASELFITLSYGGLLYIYPQDLKQDLQALMQYIQLHKINLIPALPAAALEELTPTDNMPIKTIIIGGDVCTQKTIERWSNHVRLINAYGPTETCVCATLHVYQPGDPSNNIGKPIANTQTYVLDKSLRICPINVIGELYIGGAGLAQGYLNQPDMTKEKFILNPFINKEKISSEKYNLLYKTGDRVKQLPNGDLAFIGRNDYQIKLRGYRIELNEIENILKSNDNISQAIVMLKTTNKSKKLIAYYTSLNNQEIPDTEIRDFLATHLPKYMIPTFFIKLTAFPLTLHGKIDRRSLSDIKAKKIDKNINHHLSATEVKLSNIWKSLLNGNYYRKEDNFFYVGGHSLLIMRLLSNIDKAFFIQLSTSDVFKFPTLQKLASIIDQQIENKIEKTITTTKNTCPYYIASSAQKSLYFLHEFQEKTRGVYNIPIIIEISKNLGLKKITLIINKIIQRHEILRTSFELAGENVIQKISTSLNIKIKSVKCKNTTSNIRQHIAQNTHAPFDLNHPPLLRASLLLFQPTEKFNLLLLSVHHILIDGYSIQLFINEFNALANNDSLPNLTIQYKDYADYQTNRVSNKQLETERTYWLNELQGELPRLKFIKNATTKKFEDFYGDQINFTLPPALAKNLREFCATQKLPAYSLLIAAFGATLYKFTQQEDILLGMPVDNREHLNTQNMIGMFVNTIILRLKLNDLMSIQQYLKNTQNYIENALIHKHYPLEQLVQELDFDRKEAKQSVFNAFFSYQAINDSHSLNDKARLYSKLNDIKLAIAKFDISLNITELNNSKFFVSFEYEKSLFDRKTIFSICKSFKKVLQQIINTNLLYKKINAINILKEKEKNIFLEKWNNTFSQFNLNKTISQYFEEQVNKTPNATALIYNQNYESYFSLNSKANQLARHIRQLYKKITGENLKPDTLIAICLERGIEAIISIMAVLKAGGAYVPINPNTPNDRLLFILQDTQASLVLTSNEIAQKKMLLANFSIVIIDQQTQGWGQLAKHNLKPFSQATHLAYVVYTSGTTGIPKGVMIQQNNLVNCILALKKLPFNSQPMNITQFATVSFDVYASEIFFSLISGCCLHIIPSLEKHDVTQLAQYITKNNIDTILFLPPAILQQLPLIPSLKTVIIGGEKASQNTITTWCQNTTLINVYGPTEATIWATAYHYKRGDYPEKIGRPLANITTYILDKELNLCPIGVMGELYIGGAGVARGYLNQATLTSEKFIQNPFINLENKTSNTTTKLYKTGDLVRWLHDGSIEFIGRQDFQIKIRGFRIEINEVEAVLEKFSEVQQCVVLAQGEGSQKNLIAYYKSLSPISPNLLRQYIMEKLPDYMIPSHFIYIDKFPTDNNGKLNRRALPKVTFKENDKNYVYIPPKTDIEHCLEKIFCEILEIPRCSIENNFFLLGGNSLGAIYLSQKIKEILHIHISVQTIFENSTLSMLAKKIAQLSPEKSNIIKKIQRKENYLATAVQRGIYLHQKILGMEKNAYNIPIMFEIKDDKEIDIIVKKLNFILSTIIDRHEILRTNFKIVKGELKQLLRKSTNINTNINFIDHFSTSIKTENLIKQKISLPFNLKNDLLLRAELFVHENNKIVFLITIHHILVDAFSIKLLTNEINSLYLGKPLPAINLQFKDYSAHLETFMTSAEGIIKRNYWLQQFKKPLMPKEFLTDYKRQENHNYTGKLYIHLIKSPLVKKIKQCCEKLMVTEHTLLLSIFSISLSQFICKKEIIVGIPLLGRTYPETQNIVGMFANTMPCLLKPKGATLSSYIKNVHKKLASIYDNQIYPFDELLKELNIKPNFSRHPLFDILFSYQIFNEKNLEKNIHLQPYTFKHSTADIGVSFFDLSVFIEEENEDLKISFQYSTELYKQESISFLATSYENAIQLCSENIESNIELFEFLRITSNKISPCISKKTYESFTAKGDIERNDIKIPKNIINKISRTWKEALQINKINIENNFFDLGGNSLSSMYMFDLLSECFPQTMISLSLFQSNPTILNLARQLLNTNKALKNNHNKSQNKHLLLLRAGTNQQEFVFIIPGFIGFGSGYQSLADALPASSTIYGIQMQGIYDNEIADTDIKTIAKRNLDWIYAIQPSGDYYFIGHSFGALVAFEMAKQLDIKNTDRKIKKLILLDTGTNALFINRIPLSFLTCKKILISILSFLLPDELSRTLLQNDHDKLKILIKQLNKYASIEDCFQHLIDYAKSLGIVIQPNQLKNIYSVAKNNASMRYRPTGKILSKITLVKCNNSESIIYKHHSKDEKSPCLGWSKHCQETSIISSKGNHITMVKDPFVKSLVFSVYDCK